MRDRTAARRANLKSGKPDLIVDGRIVGADGRAKVYRPLNEDARRAAREAGITAYREGRFWHAHELLEPAWMGSADPAERDLDQGLIKLAAAYVHAERGNAVGMRKNLVGARLRLAAVVGEHGEAGERAAGNAGIHVGLLLERVEGALARVGEAQPGTDLLARIPAPPIPRVRRP